MNNITSQELHILIGCADARDLSPLQLDAVSQTINRFRNEESIEVEVHVIRSAGSFVSPDVFMDVKRLIENHLRTSRFDIPTRYFVHIQSHGHLTPDSSHEYIAHVHDLHIVEGSTLNCGMLGASNLSVGIEQLLMTEQPVITVHDKSRQIINEEDIRWMLREVYAYEGYLAGDWIRSIDLLRTHPRKQRRILEDAINDDPDLTTLNIQITAGILDYSIHSLIRVDSGEPKAPFWDEVQRFIRHKLKTDASIKEVLANQSKKQKPLAGLISMPNTEPARAAAARWYLSYKGMKSDVGYLPNTLFTMTGSSFDMPTTPFGPYVVGGFFFAVVHLKLTDQMILGENEFQTQRMIHKIMKDPIMSLIVEKYNVNLIPINHILLV
ncbi:MAG: hypothetical protein QM669_11475 [Siphonobacter sp.]